MTDSQKELISRLIKAYRGSSTESLIGTVTTTDGMLEACRNLLNKRDAGATELKTWLQHRCEQAAIDEQAFLQEIRTIIELFSPHTDDEDPYQVLGLTAEAGPEQIKRAYRKLSLQYHPDTAPEQSRNEPDQFIKITRAYQTLLGKYTEPLQPIKQRTPNNTWRPKKQPTRHSPQRKKVFGWTLGLLILLLIVSFIAATNYRKKTMIAGLQHSRGAFIPPPTKTIAAVTPSTLTPKADFPQPQVINEDQTPKQEHPPKEPPLAVIEKDVSASTLPTTHDTPHSSQKEVEEIINNRPKSKPNIKQPQSDKKAEETPQISLEPKKIQDTGNRLASTIAKPEKESEQTKSEETEPEKSKVETIDVASIQSSKSSPTESSVKPEGLPSEVPTDKQDITPQGLTADVSSAVTKEDVPEDLSAVTSAKAEAPAKAEMPPLDQRLQFFFESYLSAYNERNILAFSRFFAVDAVENGKPFAIMVQTYMELFQKTDSAVLQINDLDWRKTSNQIETTGRFIVDLHYRDGHRVSGNGPITFQLQEDGTSFLVSSLEYHFEN
ncbi:MAG: DnaJ domain-containing protein [Desulfobulbaceae bacterium]|nr:DnaJ domain-containing protein [Desulfobulbaceae bacterium]